MIIKISDLIGIPLDWAVLKCEGVEFLFFDPPRGEYRESPSTNPDVGNDIIDREGISVFKYRNIREGLPDKWCGHKIVSRPNMRGELTKVAIATDGPTALISAMRCYVASRLGYEIDVPDYLIA
jgi:hypothetical protein